VVGMGLTCGRGNISVMGHSRTDVFNFIIMEIAAWTEKLKIAQGLD
jgi:hypothetical protein